MQTSLWQNHQFNSDGNGHSKATMMIVDDDPVYLRLSKDFFQTFYPNDFEIVCTARDGEECLKQAQIFMPQVVLIDLHMPGMNGLQTIPLLRLLFPETCIIALTHDDGTKSREAVLNSGGDDLVSKANMRTHLVPAIERVISSAE